MSTAAIQAERLGKRYVRGVARDPGLRHALERFVKSPLGVLRGKKEEAFWALKDVSLEVKEGEVLGLIGRNGAGKTTLLKILSRITKPTAGWAEIHGRVGSLLEVGTGFHPELTGRENAFLSGAILGMSKREIERKFDEIVAFAELEKFIDTAVKHYSSGMYVRLAFAVAAHLEPEILLVDEVLAVGDINFQKKCLGKMGDVAKAGRTVVLVSHQLNQIRRLCERVVWVDAGQIRQDGKTHEVVSAYESEMAETRQGRSGADLERHGSSRHGTFVRWEIVGSEGEPHTLRHLGPVTVRMTLSVKAPLSSAMHGIALYDHERRLVWAWSSHRLRFEAGEYQLLHSFSTLPLRPGSYSWLVSLYEDMEEVDLWDCEPDMLIATDNNQSHLDAWQGVLNIPDGFAMERVARPADTHAFVRTSVSSDTGDGV